MGVRINLYALQIDNTVEETAIAMKAKEKGNSSLTEQTPFKLAN